jgi:acyl-coenzyme A synthetase/AMP-(fatty) acid ligase
LNIKSKDITITSLPISYVYGLSVINSHLLAGSTIVLTNSSMVEKFFWNLIVDYKVNNFSGVPYNYTIVEKIFKKNIPNSLKYTTQAGGKMNDVLLKNIITIYKKNKIKLIPMYGAAEATSRMSYLNWKNVDRKLGSIGKPIPGGKFYLIDNKNKKIKKVNKKGELVYQGKNVCMGYAQKLSDLALPDLNKGLLNTGDMAFRDRDGFYYIVGRKNRYTKIYGIRVDLSELESILLKKGIDVIMNEGEENKINIYFKGSQSTKKWVKYISETTLINSNVFVTKTLSKKNLTNNFKYKI